MNNAERRLDDIEERLERFDASEPPADLLARIQDEVPVDLGAGESESSPAGGGGRTWQWRRLAASLAVLAVGGLLGYKLLEEGPAPGDMVQPVERPSQSLRPAELGEAEEVALEAQAVTVVEQGATVTSETAAGVAPRRNEIGEAKDDAGVLRVDVSDPRGEVVPGTTVTLRGAETVERAVTDAAGKAEFRDLQPGAYEIEAALEGFDIGRQARVEVGETEADANVVLQPSAGTVTVTSEAPLLVPEGSIAAAPAPSAETPKEPRPRAMALLRSEKAAALDEPNQPRDERRGRIQGLTSAAPPEAPSTGGTAEPNDQAYGDMFFQAYGTNPFIDTEDDPQSTFGIDVDTASYTLARSYLERGSLPPVEAIRVEEFINYFDYQDPPPRSRDFAVVAEGAPSPFASTARTYLLRFALKGREVAATERQAAVLTFVVDVSGSMNRENRLGLVKRALRLLVGELDSGDAIGLVVYGGSGRVLLEPTSNHERVLAAIEGLQPGGSTNAEEGLVLGYRTARRWFREGAINRVILCSDGVANVGNTGPESILDRIGKEAEQGIELTAVGFGMGNYNDVLMEQLADKGDGNYAYVDDLDAARRVFVENLTGTLQTIAGDAKIQVEFDPRVVQSYRLLGYENRDIADRDFRNDAVDAGEIGAGHQVTALYEVKLRPDAPSRGDVATLRLRYRSKRSGQMVEDSVALRQSDLAGSWRRASHGLQLAAVAAEFAEVLKGSYWARESNLDALAARARELAASGSWDSEQAELADLIGRAARLRSSGGEQDGDGIER